MSVPHFLRVWFAPPYLYVALPWWSWLGVLVFVVAFVFLLLRRCPRG